MVSLNSGSSEASELFVQELFLYGVIKVCKKTSGGVCSCLYDVVALLCCKGTYTQAAFSCISVETEACGQLWGIPWWVELKVMKPVIFHTLTHARRDTTGNIQDPLLFK